MELHGKHETRQPFTKEGIEKIVETAPGMYILEAQEEGKPDYEIYKIGSSCSTARPDLLKLQEGLGSCFSGITLYYRHKFFKRGETTPYAEPQRLLNVFRGANDGKDPLFQLLA